MYALAFVAGAELTARVDDLMRLGVPPFATPDYAADLTLRDSVILRGKPGGRHKNIRLNAAGFRGPPIARKPPPGCVRVIVVGASESVGQPGRDYPSHLQEALRSRGCFEVHNAAMGGQHLAQVTQGWTSWGRRWSADIVVVYGTPPFYLTNAPPEYRTRPPPRHVKPSPFKPRVLGRLTERSFWPAPLLEWKLRREIAADVRAQPPGWQFREVPPDRLALFERHLDSLTSAIQSSGARPILVTHAMRFPEPPAPEDEVLLLQWQRESRATARVLLEFERAANRAMRRVARQRGAMLVDAAALMNGRRSWFSDFSHFTDAGATVLARVIADSVLTLTVDQPVTSVGVLYSRRAKPGATLRTSPVAMFRARTPGMGRRPGPGRHRRKTLENRWNRGGRWPSPPRVLA